MSFSSSTCLSVVLLVFVICSLGSFIGKSLLLGGWTAENAQISPLRWFLATAVTVLMVSYGHTRKSLSTSGALLAILVGFCLSLAHVSFFFCLFVFFISSSKATKYKAKVKESFEHDHLVGGQRNWLQVLCNGGMATELALLYLLDIGALDLPVDFKNNYRASWLGIGVLGAISCCNGDTWASELGTVLSREDPYLITSWRRVPRGTNGGVSMAGLAVSLLGGLVVGVGYVIGVLVAASGDDLSHAPCQWKIVLLGGLGGLVGSLIDSIIGATLQYSGKDEKTGKVVEVAGEGVSRISGRMILDNHSVNLISSILTGLILPSIALRCGL